MGKATLSNFCTWIHYVKRLSADENFTLTRACLGSMDPFLNLATPLHHRNSKDRHALSMTSVSQQTTNYELKWAQSVHVTRF